MTDKSVVELKRITVNDDLPAVAASVVGSKWGKDNEMDDYGEENTREFVANLDNVLLIAYVEEKVAGVCLATKNANPYKANKQWLFIDEVDVHPDFRRQGIGKMMLRELFRIGRKMGLDEAWVGTEPDNDPANHLYKSLNPSEIEDCIGYTYKLKLINRDKID